MKNKYFEWVKKSFPNYTYNRYYNKVRQFKRYNVKLKTEGLKEINPFYEAYVSIIYGNDSIYEKSRKQSLRNKNVEKILTINKLKNFVEAHEDFKEIFDKYLNNEINLKQLNDEIEKYKKSPKYLAVGS